MKNINSKILKDAILKYNRMTEKEKKIAQNQIDQDWIKLYYMFAEMCSNEPSLNEAMDKLQMINEILSFNLNDEYPEYISSYNIDDPETVEHEYFFNKQKFDEEKYLSEHWDEIEATILAKIEKLKTQKISLFKNSKISKLQQELERKQKCVNHYRLCMKKQQQKEFYLKNKHEIDQMSLICDSILKKFAEKVIYENINDYPNIVCVKHTAFVSSSKYRSYNMRFMNEICNKIRQLTTQEISDEFASDTSSELC